MVEQARLAETPSGLAPETDGWFVVNVRDAAWRTHPTFGAGCVFEGAEARFRELGVNVRVLRPGQPASLYHAESAQEDFLVLAGECVLVVEGQERRLAAWDFFHCPADTEHVLVGAGTAPCIVLMVGARRREKRTRYAVVDAARRRGAAADAETDSPQEAYAKYPPLEPGRPPDWDALPWASG